MNNKQRKISILILLLIIVVLCIVACKGVKLTVAFVVDGKTYATVDTSGNEIITIPQSPVKDGYTFDGWYWDDGTWQQPFTANSLLNVPLTANMSVYAKFTEIHKHSLTLQEAMEPSCTHAGNEVYYTCSCGKIFADVNGQTELTQIPAIDKTAHTPKTEWTIDVEATCLTDGSKHLECAVCGTTLQTEEISHLGHTPKTEWIVDRKATCTTDGFKHLECATCGETIKTETLPKTGHTYSTAWTFDETGHWHVATCEHTSETTAVEKHTYDSNYKCKICNYQDTSLHGTSIATEVFDVDGETLYVSLPNAQTTFSFINAIQVADGATFVVATDLAASNVIRTKTVTLEIGNNTYYVLVENGNDIQLYTVTIRRRPIYTVTFETNGGTECVIQHVEEDSLATEPEISKKGYTFASWDYDFATPVTNNTTITASWTVNNYTVTYDVNNGELTDTQYTATYDSAYAFAIPNRTGYTFTGWSIDGTKVTNANGQSLADWTYTENKTAVANWSINSYTVTINIPNGAGTVTGSGTYDYASTVTVTATEPNLGYTFIGWHNGTELLSNDLSYTFTMPANNIILTVYKLNDEMANFMFTSTTTDCTITDLKNETVTEIVIPDYVTSIGNYAFSYCRSLTSITIPESVTSIGSLAFCNCTRLTEINYNATNCADLSSNNEVFYDAGKNGNGITVNIGANVQRIPAYLFDPLYNSYSPKITSVVFAENSQCTSIGNYAFSYCSSLTGVYITDIDAWCNIEFGSNPLSYAHNLYLNGTLVTELEIPSTVTEIKAYTLNGWNGTSITIPESVTSIGEYAFYNCTSLTEINYNATNCADLSSNNGVFYDAGKNGNGITVNIGANVQNIPAYLFCPYSNSSSYSPKITSVVFAENSQCTSIGNSAFSYCSSLTSITIPSSITSIGNDAFYYCSKLETVIFAENSKCTSIGEQAFDRCGRLKMLYYGGTQEQWNKIAIDSKYNGNAYLTNATRYYYSVTEPALNTDGTAYDGNYWYYDADNKTPIIWKKKN